MQKIKLIRKNSGKTFKYEEIPWTNKRITDVRVIANRLQISFYDKKADITWVLYCRIPRHIRFVIDNAKWWGKYEAKKEICKALGF